VNILDKIRKTREAALYPDPVVVEDNEAKQARLRMQADFELVFLRHARGQAVLSEIARICHFTSPARSVDDMVLQNAFKTILHRLGRWTDDEKGADEIIERLLRE
jgi:hypothetical protein